MTPEQRERWEKHLRKVNKPDEIIKAIERFRQTGAILEAGRDGPAVFALNADHKEASSELAWDMRSHAFARFDRWVAYRHKGLIYSVDEREGEEGEDVLSTVVLTPDQLVDGKTPDGEEVIDIPDDPTYAMN